MAPSVDCMSKKALLVVALLAIVLLVATRR
jgi:hypothetical protein